MPLNRSGIAVSKGSKGSKASALLPSGLLNLIQAAFLFSGAFYWRELSKIRGICQNNKKHKIFHVNH